MYDILKEPLTGLVASSLSRAYNRRTRSQYILENRHLITCTCIYVSFSTMIVSLSMMFGRTGSLVGNIFFPALMNLGCVPPFLMISAFMYCKYSHLAPLKLLPH